MIIIWRIPVGTLLLIGAVIGVVFLAIFLIFYLPYIIWDAIVTKVPVLGWVLSALIVFVPLAVAVWRFQESKRSSMPVRDVFNGFGLSNILKVDSRGTRREYLVFGLGATLAGVSMGSLLWDVLLPVGILWTLGFTLIAVLAGIRRLHDMNRSGWWLLGLLTFPVNAILPWVLLFWPGTQGANRWPQGPQAVG
jgi:uncharacterized membrane protein YhaH (DUF805 family)